MFFLIQIDFFFVFNRNGKKGMHEKRKRMCTKKQQVSIELMHFF